MIPAPLTLLARTLPIDNVELLDTLMERLLGSGEPKNDWLHDATPKAMDSRYPRRFRPNEAELSARRATQHYKKEDDQNGLGWMGELFEEYYRFDGDRVTAREEKRLEYSRLCARMHPALPVAWHLSGLLFNKRLALCDVNRVVKAATTSFLPFPDGSDLWADLHVHLGGSHESSLSLMTMAVQVYRVPNGKSTSFNSQLANPDKIKKWLATYQTLFYRLLTAGCGDGLLGDELKIELCESWLLGAERRFELVPEAWLALHLTVSSERGDLMRKAMYAFNEGDSQRAWLYWLTALCLMFRQTDRQTEQAAVLVFLNLAHQFRNEMIYDGIGLSRFIGYFNSALRKTAVSNKQKKDGLLQLLGNKQQLAELKVADWVADEKKAKLFIDNTSQLLPGASLSNGTSKFHCCIHFLRKDTDQAGQQQSLRYKTQRQETFKSANKIDTFMCSSSAANAKIDGVRIDLTALIRALDVAGNELATPTEVYAPAIRWLRRRPLKMCSPLPRDAMRGLHLSIHAGEDYNHLLSGMRKIDETVEFCEMGPHDRIGHGLALGIKPEDWVAKQPEVLLDAEEHLDNLVWAWHQAVNLSGGWPSADAVSLRLEKRISLYAGLVYPELSNELTPELLYRAWRLRRNCSLKWAEMIANPTKHFELKYWIPDESLINDDGSKEHKLLARVYREYQYKGSSHQLHGSSLHNQSNWDKVVLVRRGNELPCSEKPWEDWISDAELEFMEVVQDYLLDKYAQKGLIIEVNPSSNVYIGRIDDYHDHPIFRWYPLCDSLLKDKAKYNRFGLRKGVMPVCVNTDDLGIFPTNLSNEFELLKIAAREHHKFGWQEVERWADELRKFGVKQFYRAHADIALL